MSTAADERRYRRERLNDHLERSYYRKFPETAPDLGYWAKSAGWRPHEAAMLLLGRNPAMPVRWPFPQWYEPTMTLLEQSLASGTLKAPVPPLSCLMWAEELDIQFPDRLVEAIADRAGRVSMNVLPAYIDAEEIVDAKDPGRPRKTDAVLTEFQRRLTANICAKSLAAEVRILGEWNKATHPDYPQPGASAIEKRIAQQYRKWRFL
jgi:hypothetical protein